MWKPAVLRKRLRTASKRIELAPAAIVAEFERLGREAGRRPR